MEQETSPRLLGRRGLDPEQVDDALGNLNAQIEAAEARRAEVDREIDRLTKELAETRSALKRATSKPSFSDLGAAFEQTLRVAEEQAAKLITDANTTSTNARTSAQQEADRLAQSSKTQSEKAIADAEKRVSLLEKESSRKLAEQIRVAEQQVKLAEEQYEKAQQLADSITSEGDAKRRTLEDDLALEIETSRNEMDTLRQLHERDQRRIADEVQASQQRAERESSRLAAENEAYINQLLDDSASQLEEARVRSADNLAQAQEQFAQSRQHGVQMVREARETAQGIIARARVRTAALTERLEERTAILLEAGTVRIDNLSLERDLVEEFNSELRIISLSERMDGETELSDPLSDYESIASESTSAEADSTDARDAQMVSDKGTDTDETERSAE